MSAQIVGHNTGRPIVAPAMPNWARAEARGIETPGQLWVRVAEREPAYSIRLDLALNNAEQGDDGNSDRGPRACVALSSARIGRHVCPMHYSHGIIRAGRFGA